MRCVPAWCLRWVSRNSSRVRGFEGFERVRTGSEPVRTLPNPSEPVRTQLCYFAPGGGTMYHRLSILMKFMLTGPFFAMALSPVML